MAIITIQFLNKKRVNLIKRVLRMKLQMKLQIKLDLVIKGRPQYLSWKASFAQAGTRGLSGTDASG
jgi:hypothetical protein